MLTTQHSRPQKKSLPLGHESSIDCNHVISLGDWSTTDRTNTHSDTRVAEQKQDSRCAMLLTAHTDKKNKKTDYGRKVSVAAGGRAGKKKTATSPQARNPKVRSRGTEPVVP